ncbi:universal stress protein [Halomicroarcula sp. F28]|uniref:universal stress protein n=1 Tax=Haloarcula salinisoli TaxID=2487746 RepID=UPI001C736758|nr:universal stress protein [Halomicroarcula salinisoli]MBX0288624.1 universal stress protein [Halomicroarcula salinisoli]
MPRRILIPVDGSPQAKAALAHASEVHSEDELVLLHVIEYSESITDPERGGRKQAEGWYAKAQKDAEALFEELLADIDRDGDITTVIVDGSPSGEIIDYLDDHDIDQVVVGGRRRSPTGKAIFGSTAQEVTLSADCPVTIVH